MNHFINNLVGLFLLCLLIAFGLTFLGAALYLGIFIFLIFGIVFIFLYAKERLLYMWYKKHPETRKGNNIIKIDGVEFILPEDYIDNRETYFKEK